MNLTQGLPERLAMGLAALFVAVGLLFAFGSWGAYLKDTGIARDGGRATGTITGKSVVRGDDDTDHVLAYDFALPDGRVLSGNHGIAKDDWAQREVGDRLEVNYDRRRPSRNFPVGYGVTSLGMTIFLSVFGAVFALFGGVLLFAAWKSPGPRQ